MENEIWKEIKGYEGLYQVSNMGRVKSFPRKVQFGHTWRTTKEKILIPCNNGNGYLYVSLGKGVKNRKYVHRLVAEAFIPNPNNLPEVNHKDENPANCTETNLEWCERSYNINYGTHNEKLSKPVDQYTLDGVFVKHWKSIKDAENAIGKTHIWDCCAGKRKSCGKFMWKYHKDPSIIIEALEDLWDDSISDEELEWNDNQGDN